MQASDGEPVCLERGDRCTGTVQYRTPLSSTGKSFPRCDWHWGERLDLQDRVRQDYPDSNVPPRWFDPSYAGESW